MKYLAANLAIALEARSQGKIKTEKTDGSCHLPGILTKPLQGKEYLLKWGRLLGLKAAPPASPSSGTAPAADAGEAKEKGERPRRAPLGPALGTWDRAPRKLPGRGRG